MFEPGPTSSGQPANTPNGMADPNVEMPGGVPTPSTEGNPGNVGLDGNGTPTTPPPGGTTAPPAGTTPPPVETTAPPAGTTPPPVETTAPPAGTTPPPAGMDPTPVPTAGPELEPVIPPGFNIVERLDRGVVAVVQPNGVYVGWRMFGYEYDRENPGRVTYNVYRDGLLIANVPNSTNYSDPGGNPDSVYSVTPVIDQIEGRASAPVGPWDQNFLRIPIAPPSAIYAANDASLGDVDGDGEYEVFLKWDPSDSRDNAQAGVTSDVFIDALKLDGTRLWRINLGPNIRAGAHYTQFIVIDADGDGRAELGVKTAPGTRDGSGAFLSRGPAAADNDAQVFRNADGYVLSGPEYFTVFDGATGRELSTVAFDQARGTVGDWGDTYGNRVDRFLATAAYLDDSGLPSFVMARGYYTRTVLTAWTWRNGQLARLWKFDSNATPNDAQGRPFAGQGAHSLSVANVDGDPEQEIIYGAITIDHDGRGKCSTGRGHGDALHVTDLVPSRPGLEVFMPAETATQPFWILRDANTCATIHTSAQTGFDVSRAIAGDISPASPGPEMLSSRMDVLRSATTGAPIGGPQTALINFLAWWDADESRELENGIAVSKLGVEQALQTCEQCLENNGTKSNPALVADLVGDWREEVIWREANNSALRVYTTTNLTARRIYTLMHDPQYRIAISWQNVGYNQPPHPSFHIGNGMAAPPTPDIRLLERE
jgi:rhamnogalacturonan endolyase